MAFEKISLKYPECWGHRGASAAYPENTLASFEAAIRDGSEGIESDVHVSADGVVLMFHDPDLTRTTDSKGLIKERDWFGKDGMEHVRTLKEPKQAIPTFAETVALLMKPDNRHVTFNVDIKPQNSPERLFSLMHTIIVQYDDWEKVLAPRIVLGLWHPGFIEPAKEHVPYLQRAHIGLSTTMARKWFWEDCSIFSMSFSSLTGRDGERFRKECTAAGKRFTVWTVNAEHEMIESVRWGVAAILTDRTKAWLALRKSLEDDYEKTVERYGSRIFLWTSMKHWTPMVILKAAVAHTYLVTVAGPLDAGKRTPSPPAQTMVEPVA